MRDESFFTSIGEGRTIAILLALRESKDPLMLKDLLPILNHTQTLRHRLEKMSDEGLVNMEVINEGHRHIEIQLTEEGWQSAMMFNILNLLVKPGSNLQEKSLDLRHADPIFRTLYGREYVIQKELVGMVNNHSMVKEVLETMIADGLVIKNGDHSGGREIRYVLTSLGDQVAEVYAHVYKKIASRRQTA